MLLKLSKECVSNVCNVDLHGLLYIIFKNKTICTLALKHSLFQIWYENHASYWKYTSSALKKKWQASHILNKKQLASNR
jgi:hypothetical protein